MPARQCSGHHATHTQQRNQHMPRGLALDCPVFKATAILSACVLPSSIGWFRSQYIIDAFHREESLQTCLLRYKQHGSGSLSVKWQKRSVLLQECLQNVDAPNLAHGRNSEQHEANLVRIGRWATPIVQIVLQIAVANPKFEILQKFVIVKNVECVENVKVLEFGQNECIVHQLLEWRFRVEVVVAVCSRQSAMLVVAKNGRWQGVERQHVGDGMCLRVFHHVRIYDSRLSEHPMFEFS